MIPQEKSDAVSRALLEAFATSTLDEVTRLPESLGSNLDFRIVVRGSPYLLRLFTRIDERLDPGRIFACMSAAAEAGVAPRVRYTSVENGISITDFVQDVPLPPDQALIQLPLTLRRLHALPPFPKTFNYVTAHNGFIWRFRKSGLLPADEIEEVFTRYERVCDAYPRLDSDMVSCHMDLKPENILFDGERVWLVGWQAAFVNDRYFDLAVAANFVLSTEADEWTYLEHYFGQPQDRYQRARFFLMRQVVHMLSATVFLMLGSAGKPITQTVNVPFREFHRRIWAGEVDLASNDLKILYGMLHWQQLLENVRDARFDEALRIVTAQNPTPGDFHRLLPPAPRDAV